MRTATLRGAKSAKRELIKEIFAQMNVIKFGSKSILMRD
jgi:hypothetical protein